MSHGWQCALEVDRHDVAAYSRSLGLVKELERTTNDTDGDRKRAAAMRQLDLVSIDQRLDDLRKSSDDIRALRRAADRADRRRAIDEARRRKLLRPFGGSADASSWPHFPSAKRPSTPNEDWLSFTSQATGETLRVGSSGAQTWDWPTKEEEERMVLLAAHQLRVPEQPRMPDDSNLRNADLGPSAEASGREDLVAEHKRLSELGLRREAAECAWPCAQLVPPGSFFPCLYHSRLVSCRCPFLVTCLVGRVRATLLARAAEKAMAQEQNEGPTWTAGLLEHHQHGELLLPSDVSRLLHKVMGTAWAVADGATRL